MRITGSSPERGRGFSLVELMVGIAIGMLAVIIIMQMLLNYEGQKRTTMGGAEAQNAGSIALHGMQREIGQAGFGFSSGDVFGCGMTWSLPSGAAIATAVPLAPVTVNPAVAVIPAGDLNSDTLLVAFGNTLDQPQGNPITQRAGGSYTVQMPGSFSVGDRVFASAGGCAANLVLESITQAPPTTTTTVSVATGADGNILFNLGQAPQILAYAVRGGRLTMCDYLVNDCGLDANKGNAAIWVPVADNIVSLKAQYGRDTTATPDGVVDAYDQTTPTTDRTDWMRIRALRLALVARSAQYESRTNPATGAKECDPVTTAQPVWDGSAASAINLGGFADWQCYRYRVFQTVVPLRNVVWLGV